jgi:hypothetical protein
MTRWALLAALGPCLLGCEAGEIILFAAAQAGTAGVSGAGMSGTAGAMLAGSGGSVGGTGEQSGSGAAGSAAGSGGAPDPVCQSNADCGVDYFCSKRGCFDPQGVCMFRPFPDETSSEHVCGCDNVTYWNDAYRQRYGVSAIIARGVCNRGNCMRDQDCKALAPGAICGHILPPNVACGSPPGLGLCWVIPSECPTSDSQHFVICPPPGAPAGSPGLCATSCRAIQSGHPFTEPPSSQTCP